MKLTSVGHFVECLILASALSVAIGCKSGDAGGEAAPAPSGSAAAAASGPCQNYATRLCEEAGEGSSTCQSIKATAEIMPVKACEVALKDVKYSLGKLTEQRKQCDQLVQKLCKDLGPKTETCKMVTEQTKKFPPERCSSLMQNYAQVLADLQKQEAKNKPLDAESTKAIATGDVPSFGPEDAKVTLVEFSDFECPYCSRAADVVTQIKKKYGDKVRFVFRQFPLSFHKKAHTAAQASLAAHAQGKFWEYHDVLFANAKQLDVDSLEAHANKVGLDIGKFKAALQSEEYKDEVDADLALGQKVAVQGTPTLFINGERVGNPTDFNSVSAAIEAALKEAG